MDIYHFYCPTSELWLSSIPSHWTMEKIKYLFSERSEKGYPDEPLLVASQNMGVVPKNVYGSRTVEAQKDLHLLKLVKRGDFVISLRSFQGGIECAYYQGIISPAYTVMIPHEQITEGYFRYLAKSAPFIDLLRFCVTGIREGQNIDYAKLKNHKIPLPPREEQDQIVRFLDWKVSAINALIRNHRYEVSLLEETKQTLISRAIAELANIKGCEVKRLKNIAKCNVATLEETTHPDYSFRYVDIGSVDSKHGITGYTTMTFAKAPTRARRIVQTGDIIISTVRTYLRAITEITDSDNVIVSTGFAVITPVNVDSKYLEYCFKSDQFCDEVIRRSIGIAYPAINTSALMNICIPIVDYNTQREVADFLTEKCRQIDRHIENTADQIQQLEDLKKRLISDVVTGKIDVRGIEVPEYEYGAEESGAQEWTAEEADDQNGGEQ